MHHLRPVRQGAQKASSAIHLRCILVICQSLQLGKPDVVRTDERQVDGRRNLVRRNCPLLRRNQAVQLSRFEEPGTRLSPFIKHLRVGLRWFHTERLFYSRPDVLGTERLAMVLQHGADHVHGRVSRFRTAHALALRRSRLLLGYRLLLGGRLGSAVLVYPEAGAMGEEGRVGLSLLLDAFASLPRRCRRVPAAVLGEASQSRGSKLWAGWLSDGEL